MLYLRETCSTFNARESFFVKEFLKFSIWVYLDFLLVHNRVGPEPNPNESLQNFAQIFHASFLNTPRPTVTITWPVLSSHVLLNVIFMNNMNFRRNKLEWFKLDGVLLIQLIRYPVKFNKNFSLNHWIHHVSNWTVIPRQCSRTFHHLDSKTFSSNSSETHSGSF